MSSSGTEAINMFWSGPPPSPLHWTCLNSFVRHGHPVNLYTYDLLACIPGITLHDAREIYPEDQIFHFWNDYSSSWDIAPFCDLFRLKMLSMVGGWYVDVDTICLTGTLPQEVRVWASEGRNGDVNNSTLRFPKDGPLLAELLRRAQAMARNPRSLKRREQLGPKLLTRTIDDLGLPRNMGVTSDSFYPLRWAEMSKLWLPEFRDEVIARTRNTLLFAIYNSWSLYAGLGASPLPPVGSYLRDFIDSNRAADDRFAAFGPEADVDEVRAMARWLDERMFGSP